MAAPRNADIPSVILDATMTLLQGTSFAEISLADIAGAAGISKGTLHYHYKSKDDILFEVVDRYLAQMENNLYVWLNNPAKDTSYPRILRFILRSGIFDERSAMRLHLVSAGAAGNHSLQQKLLNLYTHYQTIIADAIRPRGAGKNADDVAWSLLALMDGLLVQNQLGNRRLDIDAYTEQAIQYLCNLPQ